MNDPDATFRTFMLGKGSRPDIVAMMSCPAYAAPFVKAGHAPAKGDVPDWAWIEAEGGMIYARWQRDGSLPSVGPMDKLAVFLPAIKRSFDREFVARVLVSRGRLPAKAELKLALIATRNDPDGQAQLIDAYSAGGAAPDLSSITALANKASDAIGELRGRLATM